MTRRNAGAATLSLTLLFALLALVSPPGTAAAPPTSEDIRFITSDGVALQTTLTNPDGVAARPTVVEFSPYGDNSGTFDVGPDFNYLLVQIRGTGDSNGSFDALGARTQADVVEVLQWACDQSFSDGSLAVAGFSASAIMLYNSWHQPLACVKAAVMRSGTHELYRDLLMPGGLSNLLPGLGVLALIGAPALAQGLDRLGNDPLSSLGVIGGLFSAGLNAGLLHPTLDSWWRERGWRGDANDIPVLMINGFFDVESRGAFQAYQALRQDGAHLLMAGGHDGRPAGTDGGAADAVDWLEHYVRGVDNGVESQPRVRLLLSQGDREDYLRGDDATYDSTDWPLPETTWTSMPLGPGTLGAAPTSQVSRQRYLTVPSIPFMTDVPNAAIVGAAGLNALFDAVPALSEMGVADRLGLTYTSTPLARPVTAVGPLALQLRLATTAPGSAIWAVLSDVAPDGTVHPLTVGRLNTDFPGIIDTQSLHDAQGQVVQPYGDYTHTDPARIGQERTYQVELWPVGNRFEAGHRIQLSLVGASAASRPGLPGIDTVVLGGLDGSRLIFPTVPDHG